MNDNLDVTLQDKLQAVDILMAPDLLLSAVHSLCDTHAAAERYLRYTQLLANLKFIDFIDSPIGAQPFHMDQKELEKFYILLKKIGEAIGEYQDACMKEENENNEDMDLRG